MSDQKLISGSEKILNLNWSDLEQHYKELVDRGLNEEGIETWLADWTSVSELSDELYNRLFVATSINTADREAEKRHEDFMENFYPQWQSAEQKLKQKFLASGLEIPGFEVPLRNMRAEADLFREANLPLIAEEEKLNTEHDKVIGAQTLQWQGQEKTARQMELVLRETDRETRRQGWELLAQRQLADRETINDQWVHYMQLRSQIAANAGKPDYRSYRWQYFKRFDYTPADCLAFHQAIEEVVVPAVTRISERHKHTLGIDRLRFYDLFVDLSSEQPLKPFDSVEDMVNKASEIFHHVHPQFGGYFDLMNSEGLLDLGNRKNKANGGYCAYFIHSKRPFIFANAVGIHDDVQTLLHEGGHAFHAFESFKLPYLQQYYENNIPTEFSEVASMAMEYLTAPYLEKQFGGFYSKADAARAKVDHIQTDLRFWPYMAIVDAFQHWAYENPWEGIDPDQCDAKWAELERRFRPHIDWSGYEDVMMTGWQRKDHIHTVPFYYVEYGLALMGAAQIWRNAIADQAKTVENYRKALALGGTVTLPQLYQAAGARLAFDTNTLQSVVDLMENSIDELEKTYIQ